MNAFQPSQHPLSEPKRRVVPRPKRHLRQRSHQIMGLETTAKIAVNLAISAAAVSALVQLLPYHWLQQGKLREINTEVKLMDERVNKLQAKLSRNFDPSQAKSIMQQEAYRFEPSQRQIVIMNRDRKEAEQLNSSP